MNRAQRSAGWLLTLSGFVAFATLTYCVISTSYRRDRLLSILRGSAGVDGIGLQSWLLFAVPLLVSLAGLFLLAKRSKDSVS